MAVTEQTLCDEKHKHINEKLNQHDAHFVKLDERMDRQENNQIRTEVMMQNVCKQIESLVSTLKWGFALIVTTGIGFIIWYIQSLPR